jgi:KUP system potassium uptake protein
MPLAVVILLVLFAAQRHGTARIGRSFGPVMLAWFLAIAALGIGGIVRNPGVMAAINPAYAVEFLLHNPGTALAILGAVFLAVTGGEALYADMGHVGRNPIRTVWYCVVLPALLLNYAGQTAVILENPVATGNPFFRLVPQWAVYPMVLLATVAAIIASQAIITGSYSMTRQAMQLGWFPGVRIRQTSDEEYGQIYVPFVNWTMMILTIALTIGFASSDRLAGAYGTAVSTTMLLTTVLLFQVMRVRWRWSLAALAVGAVFITIDFTLFAANLLKILDGGWVPLSFGALVFIVMTSWHYGIERLRAHHAVRAVPPQGFVDRLREMDIPRVKGTAIFLTRATNTTPQLLIRHVEQIGALQETVVALTVQFAEVPRIHRRHRLEVKKLADGFWQITARFGFVQARDAVVVKRSHGVVSYAQLALFAFMLRNSVRATDLFLVPTENFIEVGRQVEV